MKPKRKKNKAPTWTKRLATTRDLARLQRTLLSAIVHAMEPDEAYLERVMSRAASPAGEKADF